MIHQAKEWLKARWPALRLRVILFSVLLFAAALPGFGALFLRVYENTLVRQTEAELIAQGAAIGAAAANAWPGARPVNADLKALPGYYRPEPLTIDLRTSRFLPDRPFRTPTRTPAPEARQTAIATAPIIAATSRTTLASIRLLDDHGVIASVSGDRGVDLGDLPEVRAALAGDTMTLLRSNDDYRPRYMAEMFSRAAGIRVHHARPVVVNGRVVGALLLSRSPRGLFLGLYQDRGKIGLGIGLIFLMLLGIAGLLSRAIARPIEALGHATREVARGGGTIPQPPPTAAVEIQALYADFADMAEAIDHRSRYLRDFAYAISHEFKTPLAGISGALELLQDHYATMDEEDRRRFLANASADADRLALLVTRLLELARADMARPEGDTSADVALAIRGIAGSYAGPNFRVTIEAKPDLPLASISASSIATIVSSLVENSRQARASTVRIAIDLIDNHIRLQISDDGPGIPAADRDRIFLPFFTGRRETGGTGLGLAIARSLVESARGKITLVEYPERAVFEIVLPAG